MLFYLKNLRDYDIEKCVLISFEVKQLSDCKIRLGCGSQHTEFKTCFFFTGHMTLDKVVIFIFSYQKNIGIMIPDTLVFCKEKGSTLSTFSEL